MFHPLWQDIGIWDDTQGSDDTTDSESETAPTFFKYVAKTNEAEAKLEPATFDIEKVAEEAATNTVTLYAVWESDPNTNYTVNVDSNVTSPVITDENGIFVKIEGSRRVSNVKINGKSLDLNKIYNVSLSDYIANGGNGLYNMLTEYKVLNE